MLPQVALLFLVRGPQPHEQLWTQWLSNLDGMIPANVQCNETAWACYKSALLPDVQRQSAYDKQQYFSIYVHTKPDYPGYPPGSIFSGRVVPMLHKVSCFQALSPCPTLGAACSSGPSEVVIFCWSCCRRHGAPCPLSPQPWSC